MRPIPTAPEQWFFIAKDIIACSDYKIYTPNSRYFRTREQIVAVSTFLRDRMLILQLRSRGLQLRYLSPLHSDAGLTDQLQRVLQKHIKIEQPLFADFATDWNLVERYITPGEREEFRLWHSKSTSVRLP